jgi:hypothetical protein
MPGKSSGEQEPVPSRFEDGGYPPVYLAANAAAQHGHRRHDRFAQAELLILLVTAAISASFGWWEIGSREDDVRWEYTILAGLLIAAFVLKLAARVRGYDELWFTGRAVAETVKSAVWRYMMRVPPFDCPDAEADIAFENTLRETLHARPIIATQLIAALPASHQLTPAMRQVRGAPLSARKARYLSSRLDDQIRWYTGKAAANDRAAARWFWMSLAFEGLALAAAVARIVASAMPDLVGIFATITAVAAALNQLGRHDELRKSYHLAAQELAFLRAPLERATTEDEFQHSVTASEDAISREHTMWMAKRT